MDSIDVALFNEHERLVADPRKRAKRKRILAGSTYTRPVRSWCLVLRANDKRMDSLCAARAADDMDWGEDQPLCAVDEFELTAESARVLCGPVTIPWPGVSIDEAAEKFGVNRTTIHRWGRGKGEKCDAAAARRQGAYTYRCEGRLVIDHYCKGNGHDLHRADKRVWTRRALDPSGEVWRGPWGSATLDLTQRVPAGWTQWVKRTLRVLSAGVYVRLVGCERCETWVYKLYWPQRVWTVADWLGTSAAEVAEPERLAAPCVGGFVCRRCAMVIYESAERSSRPVPGRIVDAWDRFVKRAVGSVCEGEEALGAVED
jgi:hypothetical protein